MSLVDTAQLTEYNRIVTPTVIGVKVITVCMGVLYGCGGPDGLLLKERGSYGNLWMEIADCSCWKQLVQENARAFQRENTCRVEITKCKDNIIIGK